MLVTLDFFQEMEVVRVNVQSKVATLVELILMVVISAGKDGENQLSVNVRSAVSPIVVSVIWIKIFALNVLMITLWREIDVSCVHTVVKSVLVGLDVWSAMKILIFGWIRLRNVI